MSFRENKHQQLKINDRLLSLTKRELALLEKSYFAQFAEDVFPIIDEKPFEVLFDKNNGRPNTPINVIIGAMILKDELGFSDEGFVEAAALDVRIQYALHLTSFDEIPISDRTLSRFRERLLEYETRTGIELLHDEIERLSGRMSNRLGLKGVLKRTDSLMISTNAKRLSRLELIYNCTEKLVELVDRECGRNVVPDGLRKYLERENRNDTIYRMPREEGQARLAAAALDAVAMFSACPESLSGSNEYATMRRMLSEQLKDDGSLKENKELSASNLQNPTDPDATYRSKAGKGHVGYVGNVTETCENGTNIITSYALEENTYSDQQFGRDEIEKMGPREERVDMMSDGGYASEENFRLAESRNINLVSTGLTGKTPETMIKDFVVEDEKIVSCPNGKTPIDQKYNSEKGAFTAHFEKADCENCPQRAQCPIKIGKRKAGLKLTKATIARAGYAARLGTGEYKKFAWMRNGVEAIPSVLRRKYRVDEIPVRGKRQTRLWFGMKIAATNVKRFLKALGKRALSACDEQGSPAIG
jgi:hypothetical protein